MNKLFSKLDPKYTKVCLYAGVTVILTVLAMALLYMTGGFWAKAWALFSSVLRPIVIGGIFCYLLTPIVNKLEAKFNNGSDKSWARPVAVLLGLLLLIGVILLFVSVVIITFYQSLSVINADSFREFFAYAQKDFSAFVDTLQSKLSSIGISVTKISSIISAIAGGVKNIASGLLFGAIFSIYFLLDGSHISDYWKRAFHLIAGTKADAGFARFASDADRVFSGYIRGQFIDAALIGVLTSVVLLIAGVPNAIVIGVLTGFGNLIPYVGPVVGYLTLALVCISSGEWTKLIIGAVCMAIVMFVDGNIINPRLLSSNIKIHPLLVIAALIGGGAIGGFVGMIVAVPTAALLKVQLDRWLDARAAKLAVSAGTDHKTQEIE